MSIVVQFGDGNRCEDWPPSFQGKVRNGVSGCAVEHPYLPAVGGSDDVDLAIAVHVADGDAADQEKSTNVLSGRRKLSYLLTKPLT